MIEDLDLSLDFFRCGAVRYFENKLRLVTREIQAIGQRLIHYFNSSTCPITAMLNVSRSESMLKSSLTRV
jgi:hypothetical protein